MHTITGIAPQQKGKLMNVLVDGKFCFSADGGFIADEDIYEGRTLEDGELAALKKAARVRKAVRDSLNLLERRDYSERELAKKLADRGHEEEDAEAAAKKIAEIGYIDDRRYAERLIEKKKRRVGQRQLVYELTKAGIPSDDARQILEETYDEKTDGVQSVLREMTRKLKGGIPEDRNAQRKLFNSFISKGFDFETVRAAFEQYCENEERSGDREN